MPDPKKSSDDSPPWYQDGLRFKCSACGDCCTGSPGYVWINQAEIRAMAGQLGISPEDFESKYVRPIGIRRSLTEDASSGDCVFFDNQSRQCQVYEHRPRQCRTWPFWKSNLRTPQAWEETCQACPGSGKGKLYQLEAIQKQVNVFSV